MSGAESQAKRISIVGLGLMGTAITERLLEHGWQVFVWNRSREKADSLIALGAHWTDDPFGDSDRILISLYTSDVVKDVLTQMRSSLRSGQIIVDTTTGEPKQSAAMSGELAFRKIQYLDSPISGSSEQTRRGEATTMVGGDRAAFAACADLWTVLGRNVFYVGPSGSAAKMKLISNLVLGLNRAVLAEGLAHFADHCAACHGDDGTGNTEMGRGLYPKAPDMRQTATQSLTDGELFYVIEHGIRFTGMPAWRTGTGSGEEASWQLVHVIRHLPKLTDAERERMKAFIPRSPEEVRREIEEERFLNGEETPEGPR